ncbi:conserved domain protein [Fibrobacter succinogenes subsp. succinogenes S85]|uniref:Conserved domain protein n=1 Tax=Fibrobacter succinogenes (strain ATCC 19169 / S85) TaxID=59374 RepID=C9RQW0_FIBSS|nr:virulence RhuM family protein [Fibrobacter succinogenes]ACX74946.1 Virulence protein-like protein [Fibrobacter succinogenes subsp. succinogenes S85]ADL27128.1 conserved domain protein [Fibrobacter succinogenes subsp. succinogenes S85]
MKKEKMLPENINKNEIIVYQPEGGEFHIEVRVENETVWLTQAQIAELFGTKRPAITKHLKNIYAAQELDEKTTCSVLEHMGKDSDQIYETKYYNLDAILSVGYRVNSKNATVRLENMREVHDRFVIVDDVIYHVGASFKDLGNQMTAFSVLNFITKEQVLAMVK